QDFQQIDMSSNRRYQGSGLGLSICKNLVGLMGGEIGVQSAKNRGSTFWIKIQLPIGNPGDLMAAADNSGLTQQIQNAYSYRLLIVEDHPVNRKLTLAMLTHLGFVHVDCAEDGLIAVNLTREKKYDLILMDVLMPELDGVEATRSIRLGADGSKNQNTPIVALTADDIKEDLDLCLNVGMNDVLTKPVDLEQLAAMLLKWIPDLQ
ncbi:MAG: response regulator, partial [Leptospiraceae bacterium]|nr:response regulator [Leptospiraceae bacterium]